MEQTTRTIRIVVDATGAVGGSREATRALEQIEAQTRKTGDAISRLEAGFEFVTKLTVFGYGIKEITGRLIEMWTSARDSAAAMKDLSEQLGVSTTFVQASE